MKPLHSTLAAAFFGVGALLPGSVAAAARAALAPAPAAVLLPEHIHAAAWSGYFRERPTLLGSLGLPNAAAPTLIRALRRAEFVPSALAAIPAEAQAAALEAVLRRQAEAASGGSETQEDSRELARLSPRLAPGWTRAQEAVDALVSRPLLWHGTRTGEGDGVLISILKDGLRKEYSDDVKNMQASGVYVLLDREHARGHTNFQHRRPGAAALLGVGAPDDVSEWDLDYETSVWAAFDFLKPFWSEFQEFPAGAVRVRVTKANMPISYPNASPEEKKEVVAEVTLWRIRLRKDGFELWLRDRERFFPIVIRVDLERREVKGSDPHTATFALLLEQLVHYYKERQPDRFRGFLSERLKSGEGLHGLKYRGNAPLVPVALELWSLSGEWRIHQLAPAPR